MLNFHGCPILPLAGLQPGLVVHDKERHSLYVSREDYYKVVFALIGVDDFSVQHCINFAIDRVNNHIDYICKKYA